MFISGVFNLCVLIYYSHNWKKVEGARLNCVDHTGTAYIPIVCLLAGLDHYTEYTFVLSACTQAGCTNSSKVTARTQQDRPTGQSTTS